MFEILKAGGWLMAPIVACSVAALAIVIERFWMLRTQRVVPKGLSMQVWQWAKGNQLDMARIRELRAGSPMGRVLAAGLINREHPREIMKEAIEETGRHVVHELERFLNTLGTIAAITPLLGLLGTVVGMISVFSAITTHGVGDPGALAGGISQALITTAAGLTVGIPALMFYRYFRGRIDELVVAMEQEALKLVEVLHGEREAGVREVSAEVAGERP
ncbi:MotA/TolQ/ExbB proton channel family protein [Endothiovibrio diazotrophicus]